MIDTEPKMEEHPLPPDTLGEPPVITLPVIAGSDPPTEAPSTVPPG